MAVLRAQQKATMTELKTQQATLDVQRWALGNSHRADERALTPFPPIRSIEPRRNQREAAMPFPVTLRVGETTVTTIVSPHA